MTVNQYLQSWKDRGIREIAFYGGTFTDIDADTQQELLSTAWRFIRDGFVDRLRVSTRPDAIDDKRLALLKRYGVTTVELGVQSMDDVVLEKSGRGHTSDDTRAAVKLLKKNEFRVGIQIMPGLPGDTNETVLYTANEVASMLPDFIRIYPTLVVRETPLERLFLKGLYKPWQMEDMLMVCGQIMTIFEGYRIPVVRVGLQLTKDLRQDVVAGPIHPSFRQMAERFKTAKTYNTDVRG